MITAEHLSFSYGEKSVLNGVSLSAEKGEFVAVIGPNGSGKTTLLRLLSGYLAPGAGTVTVLGDPISSLNVREIAKRMAFVPGTLTSQFEFSAYETVMTGRNLYIPPMKREGPEDYDKVHSAMERLMVWELKDKSVCNLSAGERQRVAIARAIAQDAPILLMDEPVSNLDIHHRGRALTVAKELTKEGKCVLSVLHDMDLAAVFADRIVVLKDGKVFMEGTPKEVLTEENIYGAFGVHARIRQEGGIPRVQIEYLV